MGVEDNYAYASRTHASLLLDLKDPCDQQAWGEFVRRYGPMIRRWCNKWFPRDAEDMTQEVLLKLVSCLTRFRYDPSRGRFRGWLKTVTNNLVKELAPRAGSPVDVDWSSLDLVAARTDLLVRLAREYDLELLEIARGRVRGRVEARTWSAYVETAECGRRPAEVARELGMRVGTVYQARHSVLNELRREIVLLENTQTS
jgi:RNA polymerase sigma-70 factor (ECF subfamily)